MAVRTAGAAVLEEFIRAACCRGFLPLRGTAFQIKKVCLKATPLQDGNETLTNGAHEITEIPEVFLLK